MASNPKNKMAKCNACGRSNERRAMYQIQKNGIESLWYCRKKDECDSYIAELAVAP